MNKEIELYKIDILLLDIINNVLLNKYLDNTIELEYILNNFDELILDINSKENSEKEFNILVRLNTVINKIYGDKIENFQIIDNDYFPNKIDDLRKFTLQNLQDIYQIINSKEF